MKNSRYALGIWLRVSLFALLMCVTVELAWFQRLFANACLFGVLAAMVWLDLARYLAKGDRLLEQFVDGLVAANFDLAVLPSPDRSFGGLRSALGRALTALNGTRIQKQRTIDHLQSLLDSVSVACFVAHADGTVTLANRAARQLAGQPLNWLEQASAVGPAAAATVLGLSIGERKVVRLANGQRVLASAAYFGAEGVGVRLLSLQNIGSELDAAELKAWQDLVKILAHEMLSSLTPIVSIAESLKDMFPKSEPEAGSALSGAHAIDTIARRCAGLMSFVDRYRKVAQLPPAHLQPVPIGPLLTSIEQLLHLRLAERNIVYRTRVEPSMLSVLADTALLEQALINVVSNAVDAVRDAENPLVEVECRIQGTWVAIRVIDNGVGIKPDNLERIFVPFFTTKDGGSGIGLSLARQIMSAHKGQIEVTSSSTQGTMITLLVQSVAGNRSAEPAEWQA